MGRSKNADRWLPANPLRFGAFARSLAHSSTVSQRGKNLRGRDIEALLQACQRPIEITHVTLDGWLKGEVEPSEGYVKLLRQQFPMSPDWLVPTLDSSPLRRFLCALDIWGSQTNSPSRTLDVTSADITVGKGLASLSKRWGCVPIMDRKGFFSGGFAIPRLKRRCPLETLSTVYVADNPLTLMDFMFRCGAYLELSDIELTEWAIDLASTTLLVRAFLDRVTLSKQRQSGKTDDYSKLVYRLFFDGRGKWPNMGDVADELNNFPEFDVTEISYPQRLMLAREALSDALSSIGSDLSIAKRLARRIGAGSGAAQAALEAPNDAFPQSDLLRAGPKILRTTSRQYRYEFRHLIDGTRVVLCHDLAGGTSAPLLGRPDLFNNYPGSFAWGYSGLSPLYLTTSMLAHHFGHDDFGDEEIERLLNKWISRLPERLIETSFFLTTAQIDNCLNESAV